MAGKLSTPLGLEHSWELGEAYKSGMDRTMSAVLAIAVDTRLALDTQVENLDDVRSHLAAGGPGLVLVTAAGAGHIDAVPGDILLAKAAEDPYGVWELVPKDSAEFLSIFSSREFVLWGDLYARKIECQPRAVGGNAGQTLPTLTDGKLVAPGITTAWVTCPGPRHQQKAASDTDDTIHIDTFDSVYTTVYTESRTSRTYNLCLWVPHSAISPYEYPAAALELEDHTNLNSGNTNGCRRVVKMLVLPGDVISFTTAGTTAVGNGLPLLAAEIYKPDPQGGDDILITGYTVPEEVTTLWFELFAENNYTLLSTTDPDA